MLLKIITVTLIITKKIFYDNWSLVIVISHQSTPITISTHVRDFSKQWGCCINLQLNSASSFFLILNLYSRECF